MSAYTSNELMDMAEQYMIYGKKMYPAVLDRGDGVYLYDKEGSGDFYSMETHEMCLEELKSLGLKRKEDDWCFERYNCPRFTTPDEAGNVILDYGISIED